MSNIQYVTDSAGQVLYVQIPIETYKELTGKTKLKSIHPNRTSATDKPKAYSVEEIRKEHASAYSPWTTEEERQLKN